MNLKFGLSFHSGWKFLAHGCHASEEDIILIFDLSIVRLSRLQVLQDFLI